MTGTTEGSSSGVAAVSSQQSSDDDADDFCHALVLSLREMSVAENGFCGKLRPNADYAIALAIERDEAKAFIDSVALSRSLQHQDPIPTELLTAFEDEDARETRDREFAVRVSRGGTLPPMQFKFAPGALESFAPPIPRECIACSDLASIKGRCEHSYCSPCFATVCVNSVLDRSMFPARCCKLEFPQELVKAALNERQFARYVEYQTDISKVNIKDLDPAFREMVKAHGWQLCPGCGAGVERTQDCGHMTCAICRTEFCYQCGAGWKPRQCNCELWPPGELDRIIAERAPYANAIERARIRHVFERHDEHVHQWKKVWITKKNKLCRSCGWVCNQWYWACDECATNSCGKCAFNRNG